MSYYSPTRLDATSACSNLRTDSNERIGDDYPEDPLKGSTESGAYFSVFGEGSCGEPQSAQHLMIDFTHNETDNEFVQKKCCAFWELIENHPEIHHLMVMSDPQMYPSTSTSSKHTTPTENVFEGDLEEEPVLREHTAVSMLDFVSREGMIDKSFEAKMPQRFCPLGSREYIENEVTKSKTTKKKANDAGMCNCGRGRRCKCKRTKPPEAAPPSSDQVRSMCEGMTKWDVNHPKSMEPPGRVVTLIHSVMQRKV